jgi:hypothetical protein
MAQNTPHDENTQPAAFGIPLVVADIIPHLVVNCQPPHDIRYTLL